MCGDNIVDKEKEQTAVPAAPPIEGEEFEEFYNQWNDKLCRIANLKLKGKGSYQDAVEVVQDVWHDYIVAVRSGKQIREPANWIHKVVFIKAAERLNNLVKEAAHFNYIEENIIDFDKDIRYAQEDDYSSFMGYSGQDYSDYLKRTALPTLLKDLKEFDRTIFDEYFFQQMDIAQIAEKHNMERNAISQRLFRIKHRIRKNFKKYKEEHPEDFED